jgi:ornithine decarboxylase
MATMACYTRTMMMDGPLRKSFEKVHGTTLGELARRCIDHHGLTDTFAIVDFAELERSVMAWKEGLPTVRPFYAVKCFSDPNVMAFMKRHRLGFDCASEREMRSVLELGVGPEDILLSHPVKRPVDVAFAEAAGVFHVAVDGPTELSKFESRRGFRFFLRIRVDDPSARVPLGKKFGALADEAAETLTRARELGLDVCGISFHVGSACQTPQTFERAISEAKRTADMATEMGFSIRYLNIGGGFSRHNFAACASVIRRGLESSFPSTEVIAEPGRFFAETCVSLFTRVNGCRKGRAKREYWISEGLYGPFNCSLYDGQNLVPEPLDTGGETFDSLLWGPTCDSADCVCESVQLPELHEGDWLLFRHAGAYTFAGCCDFNGVRSTSIQKFYFYMR